LTSRFDRRSHLSHSLAHSLRARSSRCGESPRRPDCNNLYDVFVNIRDDEIEHTKTMHALKTNTLAVSGYSSDAAGRINSLAELSVWDEQED